MKTVILALAFVLIGAIGHAQELVSLDSIQVGDEIIFKKDCGDIFDIYNVSWEFPKGSSYVVTEVFRVSTTIVSIDIIAFDGTVYELTPTELQYYEKRKKLNVCR